MKLGLIGCGKMGSALTKGAIEAEAVLPQDVIAFDLFPAALDKLASECGVTPAASVAEVASKVDVLILATKPYAASGAYIDRMSDYCAECAFSPKIKLGDRACPFNYLYWYFLIVNKKRLQRNPRMGMPYRTLARMTAERRRQITQEAEQFLSRSLERGDK